jgi:hypothetical protein
VGKDDGASQGEKWIVPHDSIVQIIHEIVYVEKAKLEIVAQWFTCLRCKQRFMGNIAQDSVKDNL